MKATIRDSEVIGAVRPPNMVGYLRARGWQHYSERKGVFSVWQHPDYPDAEVVIPLKRESGDFITRLSDALVELEAVEVRSQIDILRDILNSGFDIVRLAAKSSDTSGGSIRIEEGVALFGEAREMLMAAACATVKPSPVFHSRKPPQANDYMREARLGQTEQGSFVLTILSPVAPQLNPYGEHELFPDEPFERKVIKTFTQAMFLTVSAAEQAATAPQPNFEPFQAAVSQGVSANLCEAIFRLFKVGDPVSISVSTSWALNRPVPESVPHRTLITRDVAPIIGEAARIFRARDSLDGYHIQGSVVKLERGNTDDEGRVTVIARVEDVLRKVVISLPRPDYDLAMNAHREFKAVKVVGNIVREGRSYRLHKPSGFDFAPDDDDT